METNLKISKEDARETYEMLRASHTLLRMAFGACALLHKPESEKDAKAFTEPFDKVFSSIVEACNKLTPIFQVNEVPAS